MALFHVVGLLGAVGSTAVVPFSPNVSVGIPVGFAKESPFSAGDLSVCFRHLPELPVVHLLALEPSGLPSVDLAIADALMDPELLPGLGAMYLTVITLCVDGGGPETDQEREDHYPVFHDHCCLGEQSRF